MTVDDLFNQIHPDAKWVTMGRRKAREATIFTEAAK